MLPKRAIEKAIEGGWRKGWHLKEYGSYAITLGCDPGDNDYEGLSDIALDPSFWQSLEKALGWLKWTCKEDGCFSTSDPSMVTRPTVETWKWHAHCFYDRIITGGDTEGFWAELLK